MTIRAAFGWVTRAANIVALVMLLALTPLLILGVGYLWAPLVILFLWLVTRGDWRRYGTVRLILNLPLALAVGGGLIALAWGTTHLRERWPTSTYHIEDTKDE